MFRLLIGVLSCLLAVSVTWADGLIIVPHPPSPLPSTTPLEVAYHHVKVKVDDAAAITTIDQEFVNPTDLLLEGTYIFPLPAGAHVDRFTMEVNGKPTDAELLPADKARALYEEIVRRRRDPALLEYVGKDVFRARIFPIEPRSHKRVSIQYTQLLRRDAGLAEYVYPLNTEKFSSKPLENVSIKVEIETKEALKSVYCPTHAAEVRRDGERRAVVGWEDRNVKPDGDFKVLFRTAAEPVALSLLTHKPLGEEEGFFLLLASPGLTTTGNSQPKDIVFVIDTSGSMAGGKLEQAKKALQFCLNNLATGDRFDVVRFSTDAESYFDGVVPAETANLAKAETFVQGLRPIGGTSIADALDRAITSLEKSRQPSHPTYVLFLTDGLPTVGETREDAILKRVNDRAPHVRVFSLGVGSDVNTQLLDRLTSETRAANQYVMPQEDLEVKLSSLYMKIRDPALTDVSLKCSGDVRLTQLYPSELPDLFSGESLVLLGRYRGKGAARVVLTGRQGGEVKTFTLDATFPDARGENEYIPRLWASRRVGWLLDEIRLRGESTELRDEVTQLARRYAIVTPYTSYLILEDEARRNVPAEVRSFGPVSAASPAPAAAQFGSRLYTSAKGESRDAQARTGGVAVENAVRVQSLRENSSLAGTVQGGSSVMGAFSGDVHASLNAGATQQQNVRVANGRSFYQNGARWVDSQTQLQKNPRVQQVKFGSDDYFALLKQHPEMMPSFALGEELDVVIEGTLYQVRS